MDHSFFVEKETAHVERLEPHLQELPEILYGPDNCYRWTKKRRQALNHILRQREQGVAKPIIPVTGVIPYVIAAMSDDELAAELRVEWDQCCCYVPTGKAYDRERHIQHLLANLRRWQTMTIRNYVPFDTGDQWLASINRKLNELRYSPRERR